MPEPTKLKVLVCSFPYGGNGGISSEIPAVRHWMLQLFTTAQKDPRVSQIGCFDLSDTPITMTRNRAVLEARKFGADVLIMVDSDQSPDCEPDATQRFWDSSFDFLYKHYHKGPVCVFAPYCGPPPHEIVYVFHYDNQRNDSPDADFNLIAYTRPHAAMMSGIQPAAAGPTGLMMVDMRCFDLTEPRKEGDKPWFYYEWKDLYQSEKISTEDVTFTRDLAWMGQAKLGYNPVYCNWDCWAGHAKPLTVRKPRPIANDYVVGQLRHAFESGYRGDVQMSYIDIDAGILPSGEIAAIEPDEDHRHKVWTQEEIVESVKSGVDMNGSGHDRKVLRVLANEALKNLPEPAVAIEVGCNEGVGSEIIANQLNHSGVLFCVDTFGGTNTDMTRAITDLTGGSDELKQRFLNRVKPFGRAVQLIESESKIAATQFLDKEVDFIYIDAGHSYDEVKADITAWLPKVKDGGLVCGHDYCKGFPGVMRAVDELYKTYDVQTEANMWWFYKTPKHAASNQKTLAAA